MKMVAVALVTFLAAIVAGKHFGGYVMGIGDLQKQALVVGAFALCCWAAGFLAGRFSK